MVITIKLIVIMNVVFVIKLHLCELSRRGKSHWEFIRSNCYFYIQFS